MRTPETHSPYDGRRYTAAERWWLETMTPAQLESIQARFATLNLDDKEPDF